MIGFIGAARAAFARLRDDWNAAVRPEGASLPRDLAGIRRAPGRVLREQAAALLFLCACVSDAHAFATCTWTGGGTTANWNNASNWDTCGGIRSVPLDTDVLVFPDGAPDASRTNTNDFADLKPSTIVLKAQDYDISGNAITLSTALNTDTGPGISGPKFAPNIKLGSGATFTCVAGYFAYITGAINLNGFGAAIDGDCNTSIKGPVSGAGGLFKFGAGTLYMQTAANSYTGATTINGGSVYVGSNTALGATGPGNGTVVKATTTLALYLGVSLGESIELAGGTIENYIGDNRIYGDVTTTASSFVDAEPDTTLTFAGSFSGSDLVYKQGAGNVVIRDAALGYLTVGGGVLEFDGAIDGAAVTGGFLAGNGQLTNTLTLNDGGFLSPGSDGGSNPGTLSGTSFGWQGGGRIVFQLGDRADKIVLSNSMYKVGSGAYAFIFGDGSTSPRPGVAYTLVEFKFPAINFTAASFGMVYNGTGPSSSMNGDFALTPNALTFTPSQVTSDLIFRDGVER